MRRRKVPELKVRLNEDETCRVGTWNVTDMSQLLNLAVGAYRFLIRSMIFSGADRGTLHQVVDTLEERALEEITALLGKGEEHDCEEEEELPFDIAGEEGTGGNKEVHAGEGHPSSGQAATEPEEVH